jgi:hypothetical protein
MKRMAAVFFIVCLAWAFMPGCDKDNGPVQPDNGNGQQNTDGAKLPDIQKFKTEPSDRFLVDVETINAGHPFRGKRANQPHQGAHTHWDNAQNTWPQGGTSPEHYPAIYAVADGIVSRIDYKLAVGAADRYGVDLSFAENESGTYRFCYGIEPMVPEPSPDFYKPFIRVTLGQHVQKGDTIAFMFIPPSSGIGCHIHFHIQQTGKNNFLAPAFFQGAVVDSFHARWGGFGKDGNTPVPSCMGYLLDADENPFGDGEVDILK